MLYILAIIVALLIASVVALFIAFVVVACIMAPELADHEACKPLPEEGDKVTGRQGDKEVKPIDVAA